MKKVYNITMKIQRFFKLLYIFALIALGFSLPIYFISAIQQDKVYEISYKIKCLGNDKYVVLQGSEYNDINIISDNFWESENQYELKKQFNFYCQYYDQVQPHIAAYNESKDFTEQRDANLNFDKFRDSVISNISSEPALYKLEIVNKEFLPNKVYNPIINWLIMALGIFILLQIVKISYAYIMFGEIVIHPFRQRKTTKS